MYISCVQMSMRIYCVDGIIRHTGPKLWLQQFLAMFLKRFYNSLRYYIAVFTQLVLPLIFILYALILIKIPPPIRDAPRRELTLRKSALSNNVTAFWAQFGDPPPNFDFAVRINAPTLHACKHVHVRTYVCLFGHVQCTCTSMYMYIHMFS